MDYENTQRWITLYDEVKNEYYTVENPNYISQEEAENNNN